MNKNYKTSKNFYLGEYSIIENDVVVGNDVYIGDYCKVHSGTRIGDNVTLDDYTNTSGMVLIGNNVHVKRMSCLTQGTIIEDGVFIGPGIMIIHEKNVSFCRDVDKISTGVLIKSGAIIGGRAVLVAGVTIGRNAVVGANAVVTKNCVEDGIYVGCPAQLVGYVSDINKITETANRDIDFDPVLREKYLSEINGCGTYSYKEEEKSK